MSLFVRPQSSRSWDKSGKILPGEPCMSKRMVASFTDSLISIVV